MILLKWPTVVLVRVLAAAWLSLQRRIALPAQLKIMLLFTAVFLILAVFSHVNTGDRHILPVYPFLLLLCAALWQPGESRCAIRVLLVAAVVLNSIDCLRFAPDYLSYFTPFVRADQSYEFLSDSNVDWGQGLLALRDYERKHPDEQIHLAYFGSVNPSLYGIREIALPEGEKAGGTVVIGASMLSGEHLRSPRAYLWGLKFPRVAILDDSLYVFRVPGKVNDTSAH